MIAIRTISFIILLKLYTKHQIAYLHNINTKIDQPSSHTHTSTEEQSTYLKNTNRDKVQSITAAPEKGKQQSTAVFFNECI
jgi:hypothetical protein